jgi:hypothetical protein
MSSGSTVPNPDPELMNEQNFDFAKPKLFFKNIGCYAATSTYIHVRIPFKEIDKTDRRGVADRQTGNTEERMDRQTEIDRYT